MNVFLRCAFQYAGVFVGVGSSVVCAMRESVQLAALLSKWEAALWFGFAAVVLSEQLCCAMFFC